MRRNERRVRQQLLPHFADLDQIVAVGAVTVKKDHELARAAGARGKSGTIKLCHSPSADLPPCRRLAARCAALPLRLLSRGGPRLSMSELSALECRCQNCV